VPTPRPTATPTPIPVDLVMPFPDERWTVVSVLGDETCGLRERDQNVVCWTSKGLGPPYAGTYRTWRGGCGIHIDGTAGCNRDGTNAAPGDVSRRDAGLRLRDNGSIACWAPATSAGAPSGTFISIDSYNQVTCVVATAGDVKCWGLDQGSLINPGPVVSVRLGYNYACGLRTDKTVSCWGNNAFGRAAPPAGTFTDIATGGYESCGIRTDGSIACWGQPARTERTPTSGSYIAVAIGYAASGNEHACAIRDDHRMVCWGDRPYAR
jgi:hypothetical protein